MRTLKYALLAIPALLMVPAVAQAVPVPSPSVPDGVQRQETPQMSEDEDSVGTMVTRTDDKEFTPEQSARIASKMREIQEDCSVRAPQGSFADCMVQTTLAAWARGEFGPNIRVRPVRVLRSERE